MQSVASAEILECACSLATFCGTHFEVHVFFPGFNSP
jgi:hypothetical protein